MAGNFFNHLPGLHKFIWKGRGHHHSDESSSTVSSSGSGSGSSSTGPFPVSGGYRARKSISESSSSRLIPQMSMSLINRGLLNPTGENNCFLNSAVQILWHIDVFRRSFRKVKGHMCVEKACIFCALKELFQEFQHGGQSAIPPDILRRAMAECYEEQHRFQLGLMDDAAECFEKILEQIHIHMTGSEEMDTCSTKHCISHQKFALTLLERTECVCGATSEPLSFVQFVHYISSSAIAKEAEKYAERDAEKAGPPAPPTAGTTKDPPTSATTITQEATPTSTATPPVNVPEVAAGGVGSSPRTTPRSRLYSASQVNFGKILNHAGSFGEDRKCPDFERCKQKVTVKRILLNCPDIVCLGMIWDSDRPSVEEIMSVVLSIGLTLQLSELFDHVFTDSAQINQYKLTALIAYYGRHYSTFCYHSKMKEWVYFDDAKFRTIGSDWDDVCEEIRKAHYQPLLLVYTNPFGEEIDTSEAPKVVTKMEPSEQKGVAKSEGLMSISEEAPAKEKDPPPKAQQQASQPGATGSAEVSKKPADVNKNSAVDVGKKSPAASSRGLTNSVPKAAPPTHTIDPMTLSLIPLTTAGKGAAATKATPTSPVVEGNPASATPTPQGATPTSALDMVRLGFAAASNEGSVGSGNEGVATSSSSGRGTTSGDLMSFSLSPAVVEEMLQQPSQRSKVVTGERQLESVPFSAADSDKNEDLIQFSLTPAQLGIAGASQRSIGGAKISSHSPTRVPKATTISPAHERTGGGGVVATHFNGATPPLKPMWEHFSEPSSKPVAVAPQKLIPPPAKGGGPPVKPDLHGNRDGKQQQQSSAAEIGKAWTMVTKVSGGSSFAPAPLPTEGGGGGGGGVASPAVRQLKKVASLSEVNEGAMLMKEEGGVVIGDFELNSVSMAAGEKGSDGPRPAVTTSDRRFSPLPPTPDEPRMPTLQFSKTSPPSSSSRKVTKSTADASPQHGVGSKFKGRGDGGRKFDYADIDLEMPQISRERGGAAVAAAEVKIPPAGVKGRQLKEGRVDYAEIRPEDLQKIKSKSKPPGSGSGGVSGGVALSRPPASGGGVGVSGSVASKSGRGRHQEEDYARLVDISTEELSKRGSGAGQSAPPPAPDPLYAVVDKTKRPPPSSSSSSSSSGGGVARPRPHSQWESPGAQRAAQRGVTLTTGPAKPSQARTENVIGRLSESTRQKLQEAQDLFAKGEASAGSDDTVAMMLYQQCSNLLFEVLQDPLIKATPTLHQQIQSKREEGIRRCQALQRKCARPSPPQQDAVKPQGDCKRCGKRRDLGPQGFCGPCQLRERMKLK